MNVSIYLKEYWIGNFNTSKNRRLLNLYKVFREITESTNNFQHKPVICLAKYYLKVEKIVKAEGHTIAIEFANMLER